MKTRQTTTESQRKQKRYLHDEKTQSEQKKTETGKVVQLKQIEDGEHTSEAT